MEIGGPELGQGPSVVLYASVEWMADVDVDDDNGALLLG